MGDARFAFLLSSFFGKIPRNAREKKTERRPRTPYHDARHTPHPPPAMSSSAQHTTDTPMEGDIMGHMENAFAKLFAQTHLKGKECVMCGNLRSSAGSDCRLCTCALVCYCSLECQRNDWSDHKARYEHARPIRDRIAEIGLVAWAAAEHQLATQEAIPDKTDAQEALRARSITWPSRPRRYPAHPQI